MSDEVVSKTDQPTSVHPVVAAFSAWIVPGLGHFLLGRRLRGGAFLILVASAVVIGTQLQGRLWEVFLGPPLAMLATWGTIGMGALYGVLQAIDYEGSLYAGGFEYGSAFIVSAGLMNLLLVLDAWDIAVGKKP